MPYKSSPLLTLIVPVFNEQNSIDNFLMRVNQVLSSCEISAEILFIDDGSVDDTLKCLINYADKSSNIRVISFTRNFGKESAISAGIDHAKGDVIIPMDVDLQDPPEVIPLFVEKWRDGYDVVYGVRQCRKSDGYVKRSTAKLFYKIFNIFSHTKIPDNVGDFRLFDRRVADVVKSLPERNRFMKGLFSWAGFRSIGVAYDRPERALGTTKWNYWKLWNFAIDGVVGFTTMPLRVWSYIGFILALMSFSYGVYIVIRTMLYGVDIPGYASLLTMVLFLGGAQLLSIGVIGEYLGRIMVEVKMRPNYVIDKYYDNSEN